MVDVKALRKKGIKPPTIDNSNGFLECMNQNPLKACAGFAAAGITEYYMYKLSGNKNPDQSMRRSPLFCWWLFRGTKCASHTNKKDVNEGSPWSYYRTLISQGACDIALYDKPTVIDTNPGVHQPCGGYNGHFTTTPSANANNNANSKRIFNGHEVLSRDPDVWIQTLHDGDVILFGSCRFPSDYGNSGGSALLSNSIISFFHLFI